MRSKLAFEARYDELDKAIRPQGIERSWFWGSDDEMRPWYPRLLTAVELALEGQDVVYAAFTRVDHHEVVLTFTAFSDKTVVVATVVDLNDDDAPVSVSYVPRSRIRSIEVSGSRPFDLESKDAVFWPGNLRIGVVYDGLVEPVVLEGDSRDQTREDDQSAIWRLYKALRSELA